MTAQAERLIGAAILGIFLVLTTGFVVWLVEAGTK